MSRSERDRLPHGPGSSENGVEPPPGEGEAEAFGTWLRRQREGREIDLREIAETSKISIRYLQALESGRFDLLPAAVFAKGFLRQYARYVGLDPEEVVNAFLAAQRDPEGELEDQRPAGGQRSVGLGWAVAVVATIVALVLFVFWLRAVQDRPDEPREPVAPAAEPESSAAAPGSDPSTGAGPELPAEPGIPVDASATAANAAAAPEAGAPLRVIVDFLGRCWVEARVDGEPAVAETRVQGESLELVAQEEVVLRVGDARAVEVEVDGQPWPIDAPEGTVREWTFRAGATRGAPGSAP